MHDLRHAFDGQESDEVVYCFSRPFPLAFLPTVAVFLTILLLSFAAQYGLAAGGLAISIGNITSLAVIILGIFELFVLVIFLIACIDFYYDVVIVTDRRVVDIDQETLFFRSVSELSLENVEDVKATVKGIASTVFGFGQVDVQTAAASKDFVMENVLYPREVTAIVLDLAEQAKNSVPHHLRIPQGKILAIIDNRQITTVEELAAIGAILPGEFRRYDRTKDGTL